MGLVTLASRPARAATVPKPEQRRRRIALIGDSYAVGLGPELAKLLVDSDFQYEGHIGENTAQAAVNIPSWLASFRPDFVLVSLGVNDGCTPNPANYHAIVRTLRGLNAHIVWIEPPARVYGGGTSACPDVPKVRDTIRSLGVQTVTTTVLPGVDGLHPNYAPWAVDVIRAIT